MSRMIRAAVVVTTLAVASSISPLAFAGGSAELRAEARKHFQRAVVLYEEQDFRTALAEFERAYELAPNYKILYDIGQAHYQLQAYSKAVEAFERYLADGDREITRVRRSEVESSLVRLRTRVATMTIHVDVAAAVVSVDDQVVATRSGSLTLKVNAGPHRVLVSAEGHVPVSRDVTLVGEDNADLRFNLEPEAVKLAGPRLEARAGIGLRDRPVDSSPALIRPPDSTGPKTAFYIGIGTTSVLAAGAAAFGITTLVAKGTFDRALRSSAESPQRIDDARSTVRTTSPLADGLAIAAVAAGVTTVILYFSSGSRSTHPSASAGLQVASCPQGVCGIF